MKKRLLTMLLCVVLLMAMSMEGLAIGMSSFVKTREYSDSFTDLAGKWSERYIVDLYEYGLVEGYSDNAVEPEARITLAEVITLAARINACYYERDISADAGREMEHGGDKWYTPYVDYALVYDIVDDSLVGHVEREATRGETALVFANALIPEQYEAVNQEKTFFDVKPLDKYYNAVSLLTCAGIVTGYEDMSFRPDAGVTRAEAMTMADRLVNKEQRVGYNTDGANGEPSNGVVPGSRDEEVGDYVTFHCEGVGVFTMNRRDEGYVLSVASGKNTITVAGLCEMRGSFLLCYLGERIVQGGDESLGAIDATTLLFTYDKGVQMTLVGALNAKGQIVDVALGDMSIGATFTATN